MYQKEIKKIAKDTINELYKYSDDINDILLEQDLEISFDKKREEPKKDTEEEPKSNIHKIHTELFQLLSDLTAFKTRLEQLKISYSEETEHDISEALDDATSALDLCGHHLLDIAGSQDSIKTDKEEE